MNTGLRIQPLGASKPGAYSAQTALHRGLGCRERMEAKGSTKDVKGCKENAKAKMLWPPTIGLLFFFSSMQLAEYQSLELEN